jgi:hypothetical protein
MPHSLPRSHILIFMIAVSFFGLFLVATLAINPPIIEENLPWRKPVIGSIFGSICVLGIITVFFPKQCSAMFHSAKGDRDLSSNEKDLDSHESTPNLKGHHPDCGSFSAHVVQTNNKTFCAACTGLLLGALMALAGTIIYFFGYWHIERNSLLAVSMGTLGVGLGLFQFKFRRLFRLLINTFFVLGNFFVLVGIDELIQSLLADLFLVVLTVFWLLTRILFSQWDHWRICHTCRTLCEGY